MTQYSQDFGLPPINMDKDPKRSVLRPVHAALAALSEDVAIKGYKVVITITLERDDADIGSVVKSSIGLNVQPLKGYDSKLLWKRVYDILQENKHIE